MGEKTMSRFDVFHMIKRRAKAAALPYSTCCHTFRATGITTYLENGGTLEHAQTIANHESPRTTKLYDRTRDELTAEEIGRKFDGLRTANRGATISTGVDYHKVC
jgi:integrase